jgi:deoxyribodipyrimidine photo-lyase
MKLVWFRRDLRVSDHPALWHACQSGEPVCALFVVSAAQWHEHHMAAIQVDFMRRTLAVLQQDLAALNIPLKILHIDRFADTATQFIQFCQQHQIDQVFWQHEYEWNERQRDQACILALRDAGIDYQLFHDQGLIAPKKILTGSGEFYKVFTPFKKNWLKQLSEQPAVCSHIPAPVASCTLSADRLPTHIDGFEPIDEARQALWPAGEHAAQQRLTQFIARHLAQYATERNRPDLDHTSRLSAYLAVGALSNRQCYVAAHLALDGRVEGDVWVSELCWRDFYRHVLIGFPRVSRGQAFDVATDRHVEWSYDQAAFERWCEGNTGVPIVDAAMRALKAEGWMHNRLRMITAMFLTKDLLIDWRWGERYFSEQLIDADLASNNGGWQWSASTGTDAAPYFRIMNPFTQGKEHDPSGLYIKRWIPELSRLHGDQVHDMKLLALCKNYPRPMVDHKLARERAITAFKR